MNKCRQCNVTISDDTKICPLCQCVVEPLADASHHIGVYPDILLKERKIKRAANIVLVVLLGAGAILTLCNTIFFKGFWWCIIPVAAMAYAYVVFRLVLVSQKGYRIKVLIPLILTILLAVLIDVETGFYKWSLNFVLPGGILLTDLIIIILMLTNLRNWQSYIIMLIGMLAACLVPFSLLITGPVTRPLLSVIAFGVTLLLLLGCVIIGEKSAKAELRRRFHIR